MDPVERLRRVSLFEHLSEDHLRLVAEICEEHAVAASTQLSRQADLGATFFLIDRGEAIVHRVDEKGLQRPVGVLHAGDHFGVTSLFLGEPRDATVTAATEMYVWTIRRADFEDLLAEQPRIRRELWVPEEILEKLRAPRFPWLEPGELVVYHSRRHWQTLARAMFPWAVVVAVVAILLWGLIFFARVSLDLLWLLAPLMLLVGLACIWHWYDWTNDYFVVTTKRVTHHEQIAFLYEARDETPLDRVQEINLERGILGSWLGYGTLTIEMAAQVGKMVFDHIPHPELLREAIFAQIDRARATSRAQQRHLIHEELAAHMNLETEEPPPEVADGEGSPIENIEQAEQTGSALSTLVAAIAWLAGIGVLPRTRIVTPESVTWRKHWVFLLARAFPFFGLGLGLAAITILGFLGRPEQLIALLPVYPFITLFFTVITLGWGWWQYADWSNDLYIVTNERIIDIEKRPLAFAEDRREASLGMIQNVSLTIPNLLAALFDYGDVIVQTAGSEEFTFDKVPNPRDVQRVIFRRMEAYRAAQREEESARRRAEMAEWFSVYHELGDHEKPPLHKETEI